jgi:UDPglucose 6-dehydrogenase
MTDDFPNVQSRTNLDSRRISLENPLRLAIVGHGFVGKAVEYAFTHPMVGIKLVDPIYDSTVDDILDTDPDVVFVCVPTPMNPESGFVDASIVEDCVLKLTEHTNALVVVKSTITPDIINRLYNSMFEDARERFIYNPEFLTEKNAQEQFVNAEFHVIGGSAKSCAQLITVYDKFSLCRTTEFYRMSAYEASFVKYTINSFLATKITFFNQLYDLVNMYGCSYNIITRAVGKDPRVGIGHTRVPGYDKKRGFGGACLPKDISAFHKFSEFERKDGEVVSFDLLTKVMEINNRYRSRYETNDREKANNITFGENNEHNGQTEEEQQATSDGSSVGE